MAGQLNDKKNKYAHLDRLSTESLEEILRADIESPDADDDNDDAIFHILEVIEQREKEHPTGRLVDVDEAWAEFQEHYNTPEGEGLSLYPCERMGDGDVQMNSSPSAPASPATKTVRPRRLLRIGLVAAATMIVLFGGMIAAQAAGIDVFGALGRWTESTFRFVSTGGSAAPGGSAEIIPDLERAEYYDAIQAALKECGITEDLAPTWHPDGFKASEPEILRNNSSSTVHISFSHDDGRFFSIDISTHESTTNIDSHVFEKDDTFVETYSSGTKTFYILSNIDTITATWADGLLMVTIGGNISTEESKAIIDSIGG